MKCVWTGVGEVEGKARFRSWEAGLHVTKFSTTEALDPLVVPAGTCLMTESAILVRERAIHRRSTLGIWLSGDRAHLISHVTRQCEHLL